MNCSKHHQLPSGYLTVRHGKSQFLIGQPSISMGHGFHGELLVITRGIISGGTYRYDHDGAHLGSGSLVEKLPFKHSSGNLTLLKMARSKLLIYRTKMGNFPVRKPETP